MAAHRYWRLNNRKNSGGGFTGLTELELHASVGGADETAPGGTISVSGTLQSGSAAAIVDNVTASGGAQWNGDIAVTVTYDFGAGNDKDIVEIKIWPKADGANRTFGEFDVQYSDDGSTFFTLWTIHYTAWVAGTPVTFAKPSSATVAWRYWRLLMSNVLGTSAFSIATLEMATSFGGSDQCTGGTALESAHNTTFVPANAYDNDSSTFWSSSSAANWHYLGYDFGSGVTKQIVEMRALPRQSSSFSTQWPKVISVQGSADGANWLEQWSIPASMHPSWNVGPWTFRNPTAVTPGSSHRWWGIRPTALQSGTSFGVREIEFRISGTDNTSGGLALAKLPFDGSALQSAAFNNSGTSEYGSASGVGTSDLIAYDYGNGNDKPTPTQLAITARGSTLNNQAPTAFDLVYSDDGFTWTTQESFTTPATWTSAEQRVFGVTSAVTDRRRMSLM